MRTPYLFAVPALLLAGCGGVQVNAPARGTYKGSYTSSTGDKGTANLTISDSGSVSGSLDDTTSNKTATMTGSISSSEVASVTVAYAGGTTESATGQFSKNSAGQISGTLKATAESLTFSLDKQ